MNEKELLLTIEGTDSLLLAGEAYWLYTRVLDLPDLAQILEVGCYHGHSAAAMARACRGTNRKIRVVDENTEHLRIASENWWRLGVHGCISTFCLKSEALGQYAKEHDWPKFDLIFIDADHVGEHPTQDAETALGLLAPGGRLVMHDYCDAWPDVQRAWHKVAEPRLRDHQYCNVLASGIL